MRMATHDHEDCAIPVSLVVADDQPLMRQALADFFGAEPGFVVLGTASDGIEAVQLVREVRPDVILMDLQMPRMDGVEATAEITKAGLPTKVIVVTTFAVTEKVVAALRAGASGYLLKDAAPDEIALAVRQVMRDQTVVSPAVTELLVSEVTASNGPTTRSPDPQAPRLSQREGQVLELLAGGLSNKEIATDLHLSEGSVKLHLGKACDRLGARDRVQLLVKAVELGLVEPSLKMPETAWERYA